MKILVVTQYYYPEPFRIHDICEELVRRGNVVTVLTGIPNYPDGKIYDGYKNCDSEQIINGVKVIRCSVRPRCKGYLNLFLNYLDFWHKSIKKLRKISCDFDIVYSYQLSPITSSYAAYKYAKKNKIPSLMYCLDIWPESVVGQISNHSLIFKLIKKISERIYNGFDRIFVTSPTFIKYLNSVCGVENQKISYLPQHAADIYSEIPKREKNDNLIHFMFMGNIGVSQNVQCFIKACSLINDRSSFKLDIVGSGACLEELKRISNRFQVDDCVIFHGRKSRDQMPIYYSIADVCLVSLRDEGFVSYTIPGKIQEYMSAGKPILACIKGDTEFVINDAKCGFAIGVNDINGLANAIRKIIERKDILHELGKNARSYYLDHFTLERHVDALEREFRILVGN